MVECEHDLIEYDRVICEKCLSCDNCKIYIDYVVRTTLGGYMTDKLVRMMIDDV